MKYFMSLLHNCAFEQCLSHHKVAKFSNANIHMHNDERVTCFLILNISLADYCR